MNKHLLITGLGMLFLSALHAQNKGSYSIPRTAMVPFPATSSVNHLPHLQIDKHLVRQDDLVTGINANGDTFFTGGFKRNQLHGNWSSSYASGSLIDSGRMEKSIPDGEWKSWYPDGSLRTIRTYNAEKLAYVKNEIIRKNGRSTFYVLTDIAKQNAAAANQMMTASYSFHALDNPTPLSNSLEKRVINNVSHTSYLAPFTECLHHGLYMNFFPGGNMKDSGYYKNGVRDGLWKEWNSDGSVLAMGQYKHGKPYRDWKFYNRQGKLMYIHLYNEKGKLKDVIKRKV